MGGVTSLEPPSVWHFLSREDWGVEPGNEDMKRSFFIVEYL